MSVDLGSACFHFFSCQQVVYQDVFAASKELYNDISSSYETSSNLLLASVLSFLWVVPVLSYSNFSLDLQEKRGEGKKEVSAQRERQHRQR